MGCTGKIFKCLIVFVLVLGISSAGCQRLTITDGEEIKLVKFADSYIKGEYIGMIEASISQENKKSNPTDFPEQDVVNSYPLLISDDKLILAADVTLQKAVITKQMPGKIISYLISDETCVNDKCLYRIFLICQTQTANLLLSLSVVSRVEGIYQVPERFINGFAINTTCEKIISIFDSYGTISDDLLLCQSKSKSIILAYKMDGKFFDKIDLGMPMLLLTQNEGNHFNPFYIPIGFDGKNIYVFKEHVYNENHDTQCIIPFTIIDFVYPMGSSSINDTSFAKPNFFPIMDLPNNYEQFKYGNELMLFGTYKEDIITMKFANLKLSNHRFITSNDGLFYLNDYLNDILFWSATTQLLITNEKQYLNCIGESNRLGYYNLSDNGSNYLVSVIHKVNDEFEIKKTKSYSKPFTNYVEGYAYDLTDKYGLSYFNCFFTDNEVYILLDK